MQELSARELEQQRAAIRRGLLRVNTAVAIVLLVIIGLAVAAILQAGRAEQSIRAAREELWKSYFAQAQAMRFAGKVGQRSRSLEAIAAAARIRPSAELRDEAIASLALSDLEEEQAWRATPPGAGMIFDTTLERYALASLGSVGVYRLPDHQQLASLHSPGPVYPLQFSPRGRYLAVLVSQTTNQCLVWDLTSTSVVFRIPHPLVQGSITSFSGDDRWLAVATQSKPAAGVIGPIRIFDLASGSEADPIRPEIITAGLAYRPDGNALAVVAGTEVHIWDLARRAIDRKLSSSETIHSIAWRPDGRLLAAGTGSSEVFVWDLRTGRSRTLPGHQAMVVHVGFNHSGDRLVSTAFDGTTRIWESESGRALLSTHLGYGRVFSKDDRYLGFIRPGQGLGIWPLAAEREYRAFNTSPTPGSRIWNLDIHPSGELLATVNWEGLQVWDLARGREIAFEPMDARSPVFLPDGKTLLTSGAEGILLRPIERKESTAGTEWRVGAAHRLPMAKNLPLEPCSLAADGRTLVVDAGSDTALVVDLADPLRQKTLRGLRSLAYVAISPDGRWVAAGTWYGTGVWVWETASTNVVARLPGRSAQVLFTPDSQWLVMGTADDYIFWKTGTWQHRPQDRIPRETTGELVGPMAISADGKLMALAPTQRSIRLINPVTREEVAHLASPDPRIVFGFAFNRGGSQLAVAAGSIVQVWDLRRISQQLLAVGLAWKGPSYEADGPLVAAANSSERKPAAPSSIADSSGALSDGSGSHGFIVMSVSGMAIAIVLAFFVLQRHRGLIVGYQQVDSLVAQRNRELERAQAELMHSQKMKALGTLAAGIAHDFNNLLSIIRMSNKLISRDAKDNAEIGENVDAIEHAVDQGKIVVRSMLGYSRDDAPESEPFSAAELVEDTVSLLTRQFLSGITLTLEALPQTPMIQGSRSRLEQILLNLIVNAAEAMNGLGKLLIAVRPRSSAEIEFVLRPRPAPVYVELVVADSGPGIAPEILPRIFEPFFTTKRAGSTRGTGLGLSTVYTLAEQDGLGIAVETAPGKGTMFQILVPVG